MTSGEDSSCSALISQLRHSRPPKGLRRGLAAFSAGIPAQPGAEMARPRPTQHNRHLCRCHRRRRYRPQALLIEVRNAAGREASPTAGTIDTQSAKTTEASAPRERRTIQRLLKHSLRAGSLIFCSEYEHY
jgi:hypothetical protein